MKNLIIALLTLLSTTAIAQNTVTWKGGTPGKEQAWNEARNWSDNRVPDVFSNVIIKALETGHHAQPLIEESLEVASIEIQAGASLTIKESGKVLIDGTDTYTLGIVNYGGNLINDGTISLKNIDESSADRLYNSSQGSGIVFLNMLPVNGSAVAHHNSN